MPTTVTTAEFQRNIETYTDAALHEPVTVTERGGETLVLVAAEDYNRLKRRHDRIACHPSELPDEMKQALEDSIREMEEAGIEASDEPIIRVP